MSDFWAKRLQGISPAPLAPAAPPTQQDLLRPWWQPAPEQQLTVPVPPPGELNGHERLAVDEYTTNRAQSARESSRCPECASGNYMHIAGQKQRPMRCYECGYNELGYQHSTAGLSAHSSDVPVHAARVQVGNVSDYNPRHVINPGQTIGG